MRSVPDRPRHRHWHHVDCRHDRPDPRFRPVLSRLDPDDRPGHDLRREVVRRQLVARRDFQELVKRPNLTPDDAAAIERDAPSIEVVRSRSAGGPGRRKRVYYNAQRRKRCRLGHREAYPWLSAPVDIGRFFTATRCSAVRAWSVLGHGAHKRSSPCGSARQERRLGFEEYEVIGVLAKRPSPAASTSAPTTSRSCRRPRTSAVRDPRRQRRAR